MLNFKSILACLLLAMLPLFVNATDITYKDAYTTEAGTLSDVLGDDVKSIDSLIVHGPINVADLRTVWRAVYYGKTNVVNLAYADIVNKEIPDRAFYVSGISGYKILPIRRIILPDDVVAIGDFAFAHTALVQINLPSNLQKLGVGSFMYCRDLALDIFVIPEGVTQIPTDCFLGCSSLQKVLLPTNTKIIDQNAFYGTGISEINFPSELDSIGAYAFYDAINLKKVDLPDDLTKLGDGVFMYDDVLTYVHLPEKLTYLPTGIFSDCVSLKKVTLPSNLKRIGNYSFKNCTSLESVDLPETVETIEYGSFAGVTSIETIISRAINPPSCESAFENSLYYSDIPVYVPSGTIDRYSNTVGWNKFTKFIELPSAAVNVVEQDLINVINRNGAIILSAKAGSVYSIYTVDGRLIRKGVTDSNQVSLDLPRGIYIVCIGQYRRKLSL